MNNDTMKTLKNKEFTFFDTSVGTIAFVIFSYIIQLISTVGGDFISSSLIISIMFSLLVEAIFIFASLTASAVGKVEFVSATKFNKKITLKQGLLAVVISLVCVFGFNSLTAVFSDLLHLAGYSQMISDISIPNFATYLLYTIMLAVSPAIFEESLFRGCLVNGMQRKLGTTKAIWFSAVIFMLMHGGPDQTIHQLIVGVVCGYALVYSGSLWVPIIIHFVNNFTALTMMYALQGQSTVEETANYSATTLITSIFMALIMAAIAGYIIYWLLKSIKKKDNDEDFVENELAKLREQKKETTLVKRLTMVFFVAALVLLSVEWIQTLVAGFFQ